MTKLKMWQNSNCDKTQILIKLKIRQNSNCDRTTKLKFLQNSKTQFVTKLKNSNCDKTWTMTNINYEEKILKKGPLVRTFWNLDNRWDVLWAAFLDSCDVKYRNNVFKSFRKSAWDKNEFDIYARSLLAS